MLRIIVKANDIKYSITARGRTIYRRTWSFIWVTICYESIKSLVVVILIVLRLKCAAGIDGP